MKFSNIYLLFVSEIPQCMKCGKKHQFDRCRNCILHLRTFIPHKSYKPCKVKKTKLTRTSITPPPPPPPTTNTTTTTALDTENVKLNSSVLNSESDNLNQVPKSSCGVLIKC